MQANLLALRTLGLLRDEQRPATADEQRVLARWSSWGAVPEIFDEARDTFAREREQLRGLLDEDAYAAARRTTINAHYTDPAYVQQLWRAVGELGLQEGLVLEPGAGAGTVIGMAPPGVRMVGVELDPTTAQIARALYPDADIRAESFADTRLPATFDGAIGNVPFADVTLHDPRHNRGGHSIHNHFIIKSLALTRPGGVVALLTSHYTLDARNPAARREMNALADLLGAVRLPSGAHRRAAGTDVVTDLLVFRRREPDRAPTSTSWETTRVLDLAGEQLRVSSYFAEHPQRVLGELAVGRGAYSATNLVVRGDRATTPARLAAALDDVVEQARAAGLTFSERPASLPAPEAAAQAPEGLWERHIAIDAGGRFTTIVNGLEQPLAVPRSQVVELRALLGLRDVAKALLGAEAATVDDSAAIDALRSTLRDRYGAYVTRYGPINRFTLRSTGRVDDTGAPRMARVSPRVMATLREDPFSSLVRALEVFDEQTQTAKPAALLHQRVVVPRTPILGVETVDDALAVSMETRGRVDLAAIAQLLGDDEASTRAALGERVFDDPARGELVTAAEYLSGNVREKLELARASATQRPELAVNVAALDAVIPPDLGMQDVEPRLGAAWIDADTHAAFLVEILDDPSIRVEHPGGALWDVRGNTHSVRASSEWGTRRMAATAIVKATLEQRPVQVTDEVDDGRRVVNAEESAAAQEKAAALQERFADWVWEDPDRATRLLAEYNRRFNAIVLRDYAAEGTRLTLPGLARTFTPLEHQRSAVARMLREPAVGLFHQVGAGKTAEMVIGTMELKRLGMVSKPVVVVPNHMLEQFSREWMQLYPQARLLAASSQDLAGERRREFVARVATNDWDAVVMTRSAFERIPLSDEAQGDYVRSEIASLRAMLDASKAAHGLTVKRLEKMVLAGESRLAERLDAVHDRGITFEQTGIDYLVVDEAHDYKNLQTASNIRDAAIEGSKRASDLHMKAEYLRSRHGERVITAATATPIANSVTEAHVMQRFLRPDLLADAGVADFDSWAATFGQVTTEIEMAPTGGGNYRMQTRLSRFQNVPEMLRMWHVFADVKTAEDLDLPTPELQRRPDGRRAPQTVVIAPSPQITAYLAELGERAEAVRSGAVAPEDDNMLKISTDGRKAALDMRLVTGERASTPATLDVAADNIAAIERDSRDRRYVDAAGDPSPTPGALQIVFCDLGTPRATWNAYDELRDQLVERGVPRERVRFVHEASNDADKARLFAAARAGHIAVLVGSTQKMGVGTNIQARAIALHHLGCTWRPADIEQREGRLLRQGNQNAEVGIFRYVTEGSFDSYMWQTVERKARFISQIMRGRLDLRSIEDIGDSSLSFAEVKALASGDPLVLDKAQADAELTRVARLQRAWQRNHDALTRTVTGADARAARGGRELAAIDAAIAQRVDTRGDAFSMTVGERRLATRVEAGAAIRDWTASRAPGGLPYGRSVLELGEVGTLGGLVVEATLQRAIAGPPALELTLRGLPTSPATQRVDELARDPLSLVRQLEHRIAALPALASDWRTNLAAAQREAQRAREGLQQPFKHAGALEDAQQQVRAIAAEMQARQQAADRPVADLDVQPSPAPAEDAAAVAQRVRSASFPAAPDAATSPPRGTPAVAPARGPRGPRDRGVTR